MLYRVLSAAGVVALAGCFGGGGGGGGTLLAACQNVCQCLIEAGTIDEANRGACELDCQQDAGGLTAACYSCVAGASCIELQGDSCEAVCEEDDGPDDPTLQDACDSLCECLVADGTYPDLATCIPDCESNGAGQSTTCYTCIVESTCTDLANGDCDPLCSSALVPVSYMEPAQMAALGY